MVNQLKRTGSLVMVMILLLTGMLFTGTGWTDEVFAADDVAAVKTAYNGKSPYYVMVNRQMNTVTVYGVGDDGKYSVPVKAMIASCGRSGHATPTGTFSTPNQRYTWRLMVDGSYAQYASRINGGIMFHSICYTTTKKNAMITSEYDSLGNVASLGCVRLQTIDAKWIYDNCPTGTLVTVYDSSYAGALGKPQKAVASVADSANSTWDPTDPDSANPWRLNLTWAISGTGQGSVYGDGAFRYGETVSVTAYPADNCVFECWYDNDWNYLSSDPTYTLTVDREQRLIASFRRQTVVTANASRSGTAEGSCVTDPGSLVTVRTEPRKEGAVFKGWFDGYGNCLSVNPVYSFAADCDQDVYAMYEGDSYGDVPYGAWYADAVERAREYGLTSGMTPVLFCPDYSFTRAMAVQMIARSAGADLSDTSDIPFEDVSQDQWFAGAVKWAYVNGVANGISSTEFAPDQEITRQDMLVLIGRYLSARLSDKIPADDSELTYADESEIADYARIWVVYAEKKGILKGYEDNTVRPRRTLTRAEGTTMMVRMMDCIEQ